MKTILLWDPRFPDRRPARLTVEDAVASAAVRAGVAAAANPAEAGALSEGGALDPTMLTEVVLQHRSGTATRRVFLPYSVVMVGAAAGVLAAIGTPIPGGVTPPPLPTPGFSDFVPVAEAQAYITAAQVSGTPIASGRKKTLDTFYRRLKSQVDHQGVPTTSLWDTAMSGAYSRLNMIESIGSVEAHWMADRIRPGSKTLTKVGSPTYTPGIGVTTSAATSFYQTDVQLKDIPANGVTFFMHTARSPASPSSAGDIGAYDGTAGGITLTARTASSGIAVRAQSSLFNGTATAPWNGEGFTSVTLTPDGKARISHHGYVIETKTIDAPVAPNGSTNLFSILKAGGASSASAATIMAAGLMPALSASQELMLAAAVREACSNAARWGDPDYFGPGVGPVAPSHAFGIVGLSAAGIIMAYWLKKQGYDVCLISNRLETNVMHWGGQVANGLNYIDTLDFTGKGVTGMFRDVLSFIATTMLASTDDTTQTALSPESRHWNNAFRRMLDPTRTLAAAGGTLVPGLSIPIYVSGGPIVVGFDATTGNPNKVICKDGRAITVQMLAEAGDEAAMLKLLPKIPTISGSEARGMGTEAKNGYSPAAIAKPNGSKVVNIDGYNVPGDAMSGFICGFHAMPALADGAPDPALQQISLRSTVTTDVARGAPIEQVRMYGELLDTNPGEFLGRWCAADSSLAFNFNIGGMRVIRGSGMYDWNSGTGFPIMELPGSGTLYKQAFEKDGLGAITETQRIKNKQIAWQLYALKWCQSSDDPRRPNAPLVRSQAVTYMVDALNHLDPAAGDPLGFGLAYNRDTMLRMKNVTVAPFDGNDATAVDGTPVRPNGRTAGSGKYNLDQHAVDICVTNGLVVQRGYFNTGGTGDADTIVSLTVDHFMPDRNTYTNFVCIAGHSASMVGWTFSRMQPLLCSAAQVMAAMMAQAFDQGIAVQDVNYDTARTRVLNSGDNTPLYLQVVN